LEDERLAGGVICGEGRTSGLCSTYVPQRYSSRVQFIRIPGTPWGPFTASPTSSRSLGAVGTANSRPYCTSGKGLAETYAATMFSDAILRVHVKGCCFPPCRATLASITSTWSQRGVASPDIARISFASMTEISGDFHPEQALFLFLNCPTVSNLHTKTLESIPPWLSPWPR
jgi:hypothetical protein